MSILSAITGAVNAFNPIGWAQDQFNLGQARDEARTVRLEDRADQAAHNERQSISGRVKEGASVGLSPLASIGAQSGTGGVTAIGQDTSYLNQHGGQQNSMSATDRTTARLSQSLLEQQIEGQRLENLKKSQELKQPQPGAPVSGSNFMPGGGQTIRGGISEKNMERTTSYPGKPHMEPGAVVGSGFETTPSGLAPVPSGDIKQRIEDSPYELRHFYRYGVLPNFGDRTTKPPRFPEMTKKDLVWAWSRSAQEWQQVPMIEAAEKEEYGWLDRKFRKFINWKGD